MRRWRAFVEKSIERGLLISACLTILAVLLIFVFLGKEGISALVGVPLQSLLSERWTPVSFENPQFGMAPLVGGTLLVTILATGLVIPFGVAGAAYLSEFAGPLEREILKPFIEVLAGIPSVVLGFFGLVVVGPAIKEIFGLPSGLTALSGAVLLAFMAIPTVLSIAEDALRSVPQSYKDASLALGATPWQTSWKVTIPSALSGIMAAVMLGIGRVFGETMAVMMVTGNAAVITASPFDSVRTMTATIAAEMGEVPFGSRHYQVLFLVGLILLAMTLIVNLYARRLLVRRSVKKRK